jgi:long-subunit acyl-CoA synthetase (AMP-forming)
MSAAVQSLRRIFLPCAHVIERITVSGIALGGSRIEGAGVSFRDYLVQRHAISMHREVGSK